MILGLLAGAAMAGAQTFGVYGDQLENGWQNYSWCTTDFSNTQYVHGGAYSTKVTYTAGYQGFYLNFGPFVSKYFSALSFYVNGGTKTGRSIIVQGIVNGNGGPKLNLNAYTTGGLVRANTWSNVTIPLSALGVTSADQLEGFWLQESAGVAQPSFWVDDISFVPYPAPSVTTVNVSATTTVRTVSPQDYGVNTAVWDNGFDTAALRSLLIGANFRTYRFPGGSLSDTYNWQTNTTGSNTWSWATSFDDFAATTANRSYNSFITVNYGTGTAAEAANWVQYSNVTKGYGYKYWEVGNEVYGGWETDSHAAPNDPYTYAQQFKLYYQAMKAVDPTIKIGAVAIPGEDTYATYSDHTATNPVTGVKHNGWTPVMLATMKSIGVTPDFIIYHEYPEYAVDCDYTLLMSTSSWSTDIPNLRMQLNDYLGSVGTGVQIDNTENNSDAAPPGKQMCSLVNGLYLADSFGSYLQTECNSFMWWDLLNGQNTSGDNGSWLYGWRQYGDEGVFSTTDYTPYPVYYVFQLLNQFTAPGDTVVSASRSYGLVSSYAVLNKTTGALRVMLINKTDNNTLPVDIDLTGYTPGSNATVYTYGETEDNNAESGTGSPSYATSTITNAGATTAVSLPPYSITVVVFNRASGT